MYKAVAAFPLCLGPTGRGRWGRECSALGITEFVSPWPLNLAAELTAMNHCGCAGLLSIGFWYSAVWISSPHFHFGYLDDAIKHRAIVKMEGGHADFEFSVPHWG